MTLPTSGAATRAVPPLAPSEIVLLRGAEFAGPAASDAQLFAGHENRVDVGAWMRAAYLAAAVANVMEGAIRLAPVTRKRVFGMFTAEDLLAAPGTVAPEWPAGSLEARMHAQIAAKPLDAAKLYARLLETDDQNPAWHGLALIRRGLAGRGLVDAERYKVQKVFTTTRFLLPAATSALATDALVEHTRRMQADYQAADPAVWRMLREKLDAAIKSRYASEPTGSVN